MRHAHSGVEADHSSRPLERMGRAHAELQLLGRGAVALEREEASRQHFGLRLGFHAKQIEHGELAQIFGAHARLRCSA